MYIYEQEKLKYSSAWKDGAEGQSRTAWHVFEYLQGRITKEMKILDIGCGNGVIVELLRQKGYNAFGVDITLEGLKKQQSMIDPKRFKQPIPEFTPQIQNYTESPIWNTPFKDNEFDFSFSSDVLEHLPQEMIEQSIKEIIRITSIETFHCIATFRDRRAGYDFHLTIQPIEWWKEQFNKENNKKISIGIIDRTTFLKTINPNYGGK